MTALTFSTATPFQRIQMIEEALERVLDRPGMEVFSGYEPGDMDVRVVDGIYSDHAIRHSLYGLARELEALLP